MCSIFGSNNLNVLNDMSSIFSLMRHRGPDNESLIQIGESWILAHQRLSIIDKSELANQPMTINGSHLIFNGEIYNFKELAEEFLADELLGTHSDTEVLLRCLNKVGLKVLNKLNGMFAFAWYDSNSNNLYLCRDRFGVKPLYWTKSDSAVYFSSEVKPLAYLIKKLDINYDRLEKFMAESSADFGDETFIENIRQVRGGEYLQIDSFGDILSTIWYNGDDYSFNYGKLNTKEDFINHYEKLLIDSIRIRLRSDVPICITLSGGLDSSLIYFLAKKYLKSNIKAFHFMHPNSPIDETDKVSKLVSIYDDYFCAIHSNDDSGINDFDHVMNVLEFPIWNPSVLTYWKTYKTIKASGFKVVLEGHGSDEQLGGYPYMIEAAAEDAVKKFNFLTAYKLYALAYKTKHKMFRKKLDFFKQPFYFFKKILFTHFGNNKTYKEVLREAFNERILPIVLRAFDRLTMGNTIESRCPFMDYRLVEFSNHLPPNLMVSDLGSKAILREILKKNELSFIYEDKTKIGFSSDLSSLLANKEMKIKLLDTLRSFKFEGNLEVSRNEAISKLIQNKIHWHSVDEIWKIFSYCWIHKRYKKIN